jgi:hypothetical protein
MLKAIPHVPDECDLLILQAPTNGVDGAVGLIAEVHFADTTGLNSFAAKY